MNMAEPKNEDTTFVGGKVATELYWSFKTETAKRKESMQEGLEHAIRLYLGATLEEGQEK
jgi:hypothetical protein